MRKKSLRKGLPALIVAFCILYTISNAYGSGFAIYTQGASTLGQGAASIAHTDDPSAIFWNPALINELQGTQIQLGTTLIFPLRKFESDFSGETFRTEHDVFFPSTFFVTHKFNEKISAGLGVFNPFGLGTKWPDDWEGRYIATNSEMRTYNINPVVSYQIIPQLSFAAGVDFLFLDATLEKKINQPAILYPLPSSDMNQKFKGDGNGIGFNLGILLEPHKDISIGASYRSEIKVDIDGRSTYNDVHPLLTAFFQDTNGSTDITLPQQVHFGIYYKGFYPLTFEIAARWEGWSSFDRLKVKLDKPVGPPPFATDVEISERKWKDTWSGNIGIKYQVSEPLALLAGYLYQGNPIPNETFEPAIPDANGHLFCIGTSIKQKRFKVDLAYGYQILQDRNKNNDITDPVTRDPRLSANGKYKSYLHMVGVSLTYIF
jgi:long-chain fatty acid transport protein